MLFEWHTKFPTFIVSATFLSDLHRQHLSIPNYNLLLNLWILISLQLFFHSIKYWIVTLLKPFFGYPQAQDQESLSALSRTLTDNDVDHKLWVEQPENFPTCIATRPYPKDAIQIHFKKFKLFK